MDLAILTSKFLKSVLALTSGQFVGMILPLLAAPILGRLYEPKQYGELGGYMAISALFTTFGNLQLSQGIIVEPSERKAASIAWLCYLLTTITSLAAALCAVVMISIADRVGLQETRWWYLMLPVSTLIAGFATCQSSIANRLGIYKRLALILAIPNAITVALSLVLGWFKFGVSGLLIAYFAGHLANGAMYWIFVPALAGSSNARNRKRMLAMLRKYHHFAIYTTPTSFISSFTLNAPVYALTAMGATSTIGMFTRANQLLNLPVTLLGSSISQVFQRRAAIDFGKTGTCWPIYRKTIIGLFALATIPSLFLILFAPDFFAWFLGPNWREAGELSRVMVPMLLVRFVASPLSTVLYVTGKQKEDLFLSVLTSLLTIGLIFGSSLLSSEARNVVIAYCIGFSLTYLVYIWRSWVHSKAIS